MGKAVSGIGKAIGGIAGVVSPALGIASAGMSLFGGKSKSGGGGSIAMPDKDPQLKELERQLGLLGTDILGKLKSEDFMKMLEDIPMESLKLGAPELQKFSEEALSQPLFSQSLREIPFEDIRLEASDLEGLSNRRIQEMLESGTGLTPEQLSLEEQIRGDLARERQEEFEKLIVGLQAQGQKIGTTTGQMQQNVTEVTQEQARRIAEQERLLNLDQMERSRGAMDQALARAFEQQRFTGAREENNISRQINEMLSREDRPYKLAALLAGLESSNMQRQTTEQLARRERPFRLLDIPMSITTGARQSYLETLNPSIAAQQANYNLPTGGLAAGFGGGGMQGLAGLAPTIFGGGGGGSVLSSLGRGGFIPSAVNAGGSLGGIGGGGNIFSGFRF